MPRFKKRRRLTLKLLNKKNPRPLKRTLVSRRVLNKDLLSYNFRIKTVKPLQKKYPLVGSKFSFINKKTPISKRQNLQHVLLEDWLYTKVNRHVAHQFELVNFKINKATPYVKEIKKQSMENQKIAKPSPFKNLPTKTIVQNFMPLAVDKCNLIGKLQTLNSAKVLYKLATLVKNQLLAKNEFKRLAQLHKLIYKNSIIGFCTTNISYKYLLKF